MSIYSHFHSCNRQMTKRLKWKCMVHGNENYFFVVDSYKFKFHLKFRDTAPRFSCISTKRIPRRLFFHYEFYAHRLMPVFVLHVLLQIHHLNWSYTQLENTVEVLSCNPPHAERNTMLIRVKHTCMLWGSSKPTHHPCDDLNVPLTIEIRDFKPASPR